MKNKPDTLQTVMLGYLTSIMAAFYNPTEEKSWCAKKKTRSASLSYCGGRPSLGSPSARPLGGRGRECVCSRFAAALVACPVDTMEKVLSLLKCNNNAKSKLLQLSTAHQQRWQWLVKWTRHCIKEDGSEADTYVQREGVGTGQWRKDACTFSSQPCAMKGRLNELSKCSKCWKTLIKLEIVQPAPCLILTYFSNQYPINC